MVKFIGEYSAKVDDKGRVVFPSAFKLSMQREGQGDRKGVADMRLVVKKDLWEPCLEMFTYSEWERRSEVLMSRIDFLDRAQAAFWREFTRGRAVVEPEEKLGRISIPKTLLESIGAGKELIFCGCDHKIEIWDKNAFAASALTREEFVDLAGSLSAMRRQRTGGEQ